MWIEICRLRRFPVDVKSLPTRECGLKLQGAFVFYIHIPVTPYAGVWIEITKTGTAFYDINVTPYAGVWIEI